MPSGAAEPASPEPDQEPMRVRRSELPDGRELFLYDFGDEQAGSTAGPAERSGAPER